MTGKTHLAAGALSALVAYKLGLSQPVELVEEKESDRKEADRALKLMLKEEI